MIYLTPYRIGTGDGYWYYFYNYWSNSYIGLKDAWIICSIHIRSSWKEREYLLAVQISYNDEWNKYTYLIISNEAAKICYPEEFPHKMGQFIGADLKEWLWNDFYKSREKY